MTVELISTMEELAELESPMRELAGGVPFRSWDWLATWWKHYGAGPRQLYVLTVREESRGDNQPPRLLGVAPWYLDRTVVKGNVLRWIGSGEVCTDHLSLLCQSENHDEVAEAIADALTTTYDDWDRIELDAVDAGDASIARLAAALEERDCLVSRQAADACWSLELPPTWEDYLATISKSHRKQLRQLERRVLDSNRAQWHPIKCADELDAGWPILVDLHQRRRQSLGEPGCFASPSFLAFHREVAGRLLQRGRLRMSWLELDGIPVAAEYHFAGEKATYAYQGGVDPARLAEEPGRLSTILCLRQAIDEGHKRLDFLRGDEPYKAHWRAEPHPTLNYRVAANRRLARLRGHMVSLSGMVRDWVRPPSGPVSAG